MSRIQENIIEYAGRNNSRKYDGMLAKAMAKIKLMRKGVFSLLSNTNFDFLVILTARMIAVNTARGGEMSGRTKKRRINIALMP